MIGTSVDLLRTVLVAAAGLTLLVALVALAAAKGKPLHRRAGLAFHHGALALAAVLVPVGALTGDFFLLVLGTFCGYLVHAGRREVVRHREGVAFGHADRLGLGVLVVEGAALVLLAATAPEDPEATERNAFVAAFGLLVLLLAGFEARRLRRPAASPNEWVRQHVGAMCIAVVTLATGFGALTWTAWPLPAWVPWLGPVLVGGPVTVRWLSQAARDGARATFL